MITGLSIDTAPSTGPTSFNAVVVGRSEAAFPAALGRASATRDREIVRQAAAQLVASTFIMPVLQSMHDSPFLKPPFAPGFAEKQFQPLLDQQVADRLTSAARFPLIDLITDRLMGPEKPPVATPESTP